jgi:hypothetical protein
MPRFEVRVSTLYQFDAVDKAEARRLVEMGEMPSGHDMIGTSVSEVSRIITDEELQNLVKSL